MFDEGGSALVGERGLDNNCGRWKTLGGKGRNNSRVKETMDELRCMGI